MKQNIYKELAGIEYSGSAGISQDCQDSVVKILQYNENIKLCRVLTAPDGRHCLLLTMNEISIIAVKSGFTSGYSGEGPRKFSFVLKLLDMFKVSIQEYDVSADLIDRIDNSALTNDDMAIINSAKPISPPRIYEYISWGHYEQERNGTLLEDFKPVIPFGIIDSRIIDLAISFWDNADNNLLTGYRRLEDIIRNKTHLTEHGVKLFTQAFQGLNPPLFWSGIEGAELVGRVNLFTGAYMTHRNPRAHKERPGGVSLLSEFLLLNHLFLLEGDLAKHEKAEK